MAFFATVALIANVAFWDKVSRHLDRQRHKEMSTSAAAFLAPSAAAVSYRRRAGARPGGSAFGRRLSRPAAPAPPGRHLTERGRKTAPRENAAVVSGAGSAVPTGDDEPSTFPKPPFRGWHTLARATGNAEPASTPSSSAPAAASGFHFGSFPLEAFPDTFASNAIPLFRARNGSLVVRAKTADDGADAGKEPGEDVENASDGDSDSDDDAYDVPDTTRGSSGGSGDPAPGVPKQSDENEEDDSDSDRGEEKKKARRAFFASRPELARSVVAFSETAEMLCLLTAGGVRVAQLTRSARERRVGLAAGPKRSVDFVAAVAASAPAPPPSALSLGRVGSVADGALVAAVGVRFMIKRLVGRNNVVPLEYPAFGTDAATPARDEAAQFTDVVSRVRARAALLADVKKDLASSRLQAELAAKAAARASQGVVAPANAAQTDAPSVAETAATAAVTDAVSASPSLSAARLEARLAREAAEATARHREIEVSAANARAAAAEEMAQAARARAAEAEAMLARRDEMDRRDEWQTETEVRTINTTRSTRGGRQSAYDAPSAYGGVPTNRGDARGPYGDAPPRGPNRRDALNLPDPARSIAMSDLVMDDSRAVSAAVDAETLALREEVERLRRAANEETEECGFEDGYEGGPPFDECQ